jgi:tol-pal system protein YbgF
MTEHFIGALRSLLVALVVVGFAAGCVIDRTRQSASYKMRADVDSARDRARDLEKDLARERQRIDSMQNRATDARKRIAESGATLESFLEELMQVRGELSNVAHGSEEAGRFSEDLDLRIGAIEQRFARLEMALRQAELLDDESLGPAGAVGEVDGQREDSVEDPSSQSVDSPESGASQTPSEVVSAEVVEPAPSPVAEPGPEEAMFQRALLLMKGKSFDRAGAVLQEFLKAYSESRWRLEAQYMLGECLFHLGRYKGALRQYQKVVDSDQRGQWAARSMFRQALCFRAMGKTDEAGVFLSDLVRLYPDSAEAVKAREELEDAGGN